MNQNGYPKMSMNWGFMADFGAKAVCEIGIIFKKPLHCWGFQNQNGEIIFSSLLKMVSKVGRNDPCPCGSGKKYKKCCMNK
ncbi:MAG: SEC-C domain-containing protein [Saprospiraceae bacterium]|nr:SEC-C domain-containing protein [Saprospiraceae bacterium]